MIDIDHFKQFNDTYGHPAGDSCLQLIAFTIRQTLKGSCDMAARYGGEEFAVILPSTDLETTTEIAEKIRTQIQDLSIPHKNTTLPSGVITISLGTAAMIPRMVGPNQWDRLIRMTWPWPTPKRAAAIQSDKHNDLKNGPIRAISFGLSARNTLGPKIFWAWPVPPGLLKIALP